MQDWVNDVDSVVEQLFTQAAAGVAVTSAGVQSALTNASNKTKSASSEANLKLQIARLSTLFVSIVFGEVFKNSGNKLSDSVTGGDAGVMSTLVPEAIIGGLPLYCVQRIERGMSDRELKYRAVGDVFLAHQKGTTDTLRIDGTFTGPFRNIYVNLLLGLQYKTSGEAKAIDLKNTPPGSSVSQTVSSQITTDLAKRQDDVVEYETHKTFPIITQTAILLDMYLQTIEWDLAVESGIECIKYHLLFRKYIEPTGWRAFEDGKKEGFLNYGTTRTESLRMEILLDSMWKTKKMLQELYYPVWLKTDNPTRLNVEAVSSFPYGVDIHKIATGSLFDFLGESVSNNL